MAVTRSDTPNLLLPGLRAEFQTMYNAQEQLSQWQQIATIIPSNKAQENYGWLGAIPGMREWTSERQAKALSEYAYSLVNRDWEVSIAVDRNAIEDDQYGQILARVRELGMAASMHKDKLVCETLFDGFTGLCYDGKTFFAENHREGKSGTQSNTGTSAMTISAIQTTMAAGRMLKNDQGDIMGVAYDTLECGPLMEFTARKLLESTNDPETANNGTNVMRGLLKLRINPYITDNSWMLLCTSRVVKPIIFQERQAVRFDALENNSEEGFMRKRYVYGADARYAAGYGPWQYAYGHKVA